MSDLISESQSFSAEQWQQLTALGLKDCSEVSPCSVEAQALMDDAVCLQTLRQIMPELGAPDLKVTASLVVKRFAFLTLAPLLYAMSRFNQGLDLSVGNCIFEYPLENRIWRSALPVKSLQVLPFSEEREVWRQQVLGKAFRGNLTPLIRQMNRLTGVSERILWENVAVRVFSIYERRIMAQMPDCVAAQVEDDYRFLLDPQTTDIFGLTTNPLARFNCPKRKLPGGEKPIRVRRTCCFYYRATEPASYCGNCPLLFRQPEPRKKS